MAYDIKLLKACLSSNLSHQEQKLRVVSNQSIPQGIQNVLVVVLPSVFRSCQHIVCGTWAFKKKRTTCCRLQDIKLLKAKVRHHEASTSNIQQPTISSNLEWFLISEIIKGLEFLVAECFQKIFLHILCKFKRSKTSCTVYDIKPLEGPVKHPS